MIATHQNDYPGTAKPNTAGKILVVDGNRNSTQQIVTVLQSLSVEVHTTPSRQEALDLLERFPFDVILLANKLSDGNGVEFCQSLKNHPVWGRAKIILMNFSSQARDKLQAFEAGADDYLVKPFDGRELLARVKVLMSLKATEQELTRRNEQLQDLLHLSSLINQQADPKSVASHITRQAMLMTRSYWADLMIWDEKEQEHYYLAVSGPEAERYVNTAVPLGRGLVSLVRELGRLVIVPNYGALASRLPLIGYDHIYEAVGIPLLVGTRYIGVLGAGMSEPDRHFSQNDLNLLTSLANQAAVALDNAKLYRELTQSEQRYRLIAEKATDLIISLDRNNYVDYINERAEPMLGYRQDEIIGQPISRFLTPESMAAFEQVYGDSQQALLNNQSINLEPVEYTILTKSGNLIELEFSSRLLTKDNEITGIQAIGRDVTARKRAEGNERMRVLGQIASGVAHDFNNVLANVLGHVQLLAPEITDEDVRQTLGLIEQATLDGAETVRRIQEFTGQRSSTRLDLLDLNQIVLSTIDLSRPRWRDEAQARGIRVEIEREFETLPKIRGRAAELREVLINLINNAVDAMQPPLGRLVFVTSFDNQWVKLTVSDNGQGIPPEVLRHIFEPFFTTKGVRGTGLGLSVAFGIITRYGGDISCQSQPGVGTTFTIHLPVAELQEDSNLLEQVVARSKSRTSKNKGRVLVVDDEQGIRTIIQRALSSAGYQVETASGGYEAIERLDAAAQNNRGQKPFDMVYSDLGMPDLSGWEVARYVKDNWQSIPVVLITGWGDQLDPAKMSEYNVQHTIAKPFNIEDLLSTARKLR